MNVYKNCLAHSSFSVKCVPGIILLPGSFSGMDTSPIPHRGPDDSSLISLAIFIRLTATTFNAPWTSTRASCAAKDSNLLIAEVNGISKKNKFSYY